MAKIKISKEEKELIKAYVRFQNIRTGGLDSSFEAKWLESDLTINIIKNTNMEYRDLVEYYIRELLKKEYKIY